MKSIIMILAGSAALSWPGLVTVSSQERAETQPLAAVLDPNEERLSDAMVNVQQQVQVELQPDFEVSVAGAESRSADFAAIQIELDTLKELADANAGRAEQQRAKARQAVELAQAAAPRAVTTAATTPTPALQQRLHAIVNKGHGGPGRALVIRTSDADAKTQANLEEDLAVMSRILDKTVAKAIEDDGANRFMGINVLFAPGSGSIRNLYLEGYGALFLLNVNFPLLAPPEKTEAAKEKSETDSTWEEAKQELYGQSDAWAQVGKALRFGLAPGSPQEYDKDKVEDLKAGLLEALKNATNIRNLKADESITICVFGGLSVAPGKPTRSVVKRDPAPEAEVVFVAEPEDSSSGRGTIMTVRVKKSDVDAFAKGKLDLDGFRKKATVTTYAGETGGWSGSVFGKR